MAPRKNTGKRAQRRPKRKTAKRKSGKVNRKTSRKQSKRRSKKSQKTRKNTPKRREERFTKQEIQDLKLVANEIKEKSEEADQIQLAEIENEIENEIGRPFTKQEEKLIQDAQKAEESYAKLKKALKYGAGAAALAGIAGLGSRYLKRGTR